jgi:uncharacterized protein (DUF433 family)
VARVADDFLEWPATIFDSNLECQQDTYYDIAETTWQNMQQEVADWINDNNNINGGQATIKDTKAVRIKNDKVIEILCAEESEGTIQNILSNCN